MLVPRSMLIVAASAAAVLTVGGIAVPALADTPASPLGIHAVAQEDATTQALVARSQERARSAADRLEVIASGVEQFSMAAALASEAANNASKASATGADEAEQAETPAAAATAAAKAARAGISDEDLNKAAAAAGAVASIKKNSEAGNNIAAALVASANAALAAEEAADEPTNVKLANVAVETENEAVAACQKAFGGAPNTTPIELIEES